jgi:hypothetical protein
MMSRKLFNRLWLEFLEAAEIEGIFLPSKAWQNFYQQFNTKGCLLIVVIKFLSRKKKKVYEKEILRML